jgi:hypothetical protein
MNIATMKMTMMKSLEEENGPTMMKMKMRRKSEVITKIRELKELIEKSNKMETNSRK